MGYQSDPWSMPGAPYRRGGRRGWNSGRNRLLWIVGGGLSLLAAYTILLTDQGLIAQRRLAKREAQLKAEIASADERIRALEWDNEHIETTRERLARQKYDMVRPDELIYQSSGADSAANGTGGSAPSSGQR